ncbi:hypothetical protein [Kitasatospora sp. NPDC051914]|uniref:hypothetical protein n=1 Tax=Kitasatospora sp. NPDC051914 TaxID=3154945 RepID=UPI00341B906E
MVRSYAPIFTGVTFRLRPAALTGAGVSLEHAYVPGAWIGRLLDLPVAERLILRHRRDV